MRNKFGKLTALSLAVAMSGSLLAGCTGKTEKPSASQPQNQTKEDVYENGLSKTEKVTLKIGFFMGGYGREWFDYAVKSFQAKYPNVSFDVTASADMKNMIQTKVSAGNDNDMFDIFNTTPPSGAQGIISLAEAGKLEPFDDMFDKKLPDVPGKAMKELMMPGLAESFTKVNGKVYEFATSSSYGGLFFNKTLFEQKGWNQNPKTWAEFNDLLAKIKADGLAPITFPGVYPTYYDWAFGPAKLFELADIKGNADKVIENYKTYNGPQFTSEESLEHWNRLYELGKKGYFPEGLPALNHTQSQMQVIQGQAAMVSTGSHVENEMKKTTPEDFKWGFMAVPFRDKVEQKLWIRSGITNFQYMWAGKPDLNKKWSKEFILWLMTLDNQQFAAEKAGALPMRKDLIDDSSKVVKLSTSAQAILKYIKDNDARSYKPHRTVSISDPNLAKANKMMEEATVKIVLGKQDPKPILEEADALLKKAVEAQKK
ncbi:extracellular solute-binding protein [Paenibacillus frigoriresistens]|uniref:ABC transporter substrate-binding protein n=1 Tax=Paenibacillus alginolyticus TaxID=59839 RepID=UPI001562FC15|nr:extracellular solute-binding protein [Paenibacillus frigoriresistens]NRF92864.1 extracellular solute-binding protein [Paenibacillus frigoriresistens]